MSEYIILKKANQCATKVFCQDGKFHLGLFKLGSIPILQVGRNNTKIYYNFEEAKRQAEYLGVGAMVAEFKERSCGTIVFTNTIDRGVLLLDYFGNRNII